MRPETVAPPNEAWLELPGGGLHWLAGRCTIGRQDDNDLVLADASVSRRHALIEAGPGGYALSDLRSSNGTYVNAVPLSRQLQLQDGDELGFGRVVARFRCNRPGGPRDRQATPVDATVRVEDTRERSCWLVLADLASYSGLIAAHGNRGGLARFQGWIAGLRPLIEGNGGVINSYVGDAIFAWWPDQPGADAGLRAALAAIGAWRAASPAPFRLAVHHGTAVFTRSERGEELSGRDVNLIFRSDKVAKALGSDTVLTAEAVRSLGLADRCQPLGEVAVDGIPGRVAFLGAPEGGSQQ